MVVVEHVFLPEEVIMYLHHKLCFSLGGLGIGIFTFISGFLIAKSLDNRTSKEYLISRFFRIYPTYLTILVFALFIYFVFGYCRLVPTREVSFFGFIAQALFIRDLFNMYNPLISADWTLMYEVQFYCVIAVAWYFYQKHSKVSVFLITYTFITLAIYLLLSLLSLKYHHGEAAIQRTGGALFCFLGSIYYLHSKKLIKHTYLYLLGIWLLGTFAFSYFYGKFYYDYFQVSVTQLEALIIVIACLHYKTKIHKRRVISFFADISFPLYLVHQTFGTVGFTKIINSSINLNIYLDRGLTFLFLIIPGCYLVHVYIEKKFIVNGHRYSDSLASIFAKLSKVLIKRLYYNKKRIDVVEITDKSL